MTAPALPRVDYQYPVRPSAGPPLVLVGEAPGADEVRLGTPFVGRSGKLLDQTLAAAGIDRGACLVANVFRFQPPENKVGHFFISRTAARRDGVALDERWGKFAGSSLCRAEFSAELDALAETLTRIGARVVVGLGRTPLWALTGLDGIVARRGQMLPCRLLAGVEVMPTFHPSYLIRGRWNEQPVFQGDLALAYHRLTMAK
ncbi:uracil-DNA glycosylase [uncultured Gammaproteobacteria bacterium]